ncbi:hypothetical protein [Paenibacillus sp. y28]|uniref:hypothetical protein n=1 Tax=Paenibacillus sp. y28 TaxID=3129110 RepID=UPI003018FF09
MNDTGTSRRRRYGKRCGQAALLMLTAAALLQPLSAAEAGLIDRVKEIYRLPEQMESIQQEYDATKQQLEEQRDKLQEAVQQSKEAQERLIAQNKQLQEQNEALLRSIQAMEQAEQERRARTRNITTLAVTAAILAAGYFVSGRFIRLAVWRRHKSKLRR